MNIYELIDKQPGLIFLIAVLAMWTICYIFKILFFLLPNRTMRHWNIHKHGFPKGCDADGDFLNVKETEKD